MNSTPITDTRKLAKGETATVECYCGNLYQWTKPKECAFPVRCPECMETERQRAYKDCRASLEATIIKNTPPRFQLTDTGNPDFNTRLWENVKAWRPTAAHPWLGLVGPTGKCKTRCLFLLLREMLIEKIQQDGEGHRYYARTSFKVAPATTFAAKVMERFSEDCGTQEAAECFVSSCYETRILLFDDVDKIRVTTANGGLSAVGSELHALLDHRHSHNLVTLWSANVSPEGIVSGMPENIAAPLAGRIRECSTITNIK